MGERGGASDPLLVAVVVDSHHQSATQADQRYGGPEGSTVWPEIHYPNLSLGKSVRGLDCGLERDTLLQ
jgi:hypothetical protein